MQPGCRLDGDRARCLDRGRLVENSSPNGPCGIADVLDDGILAVSSGRTVATEPPPRRRVVGVVVTKATDEQVDHPRVPRLHLRRFAPWDLPPRVPRDDEVFTQL